MSKKDQYEKAKQELAKEVEQYASKYEEAIKAYIRRDTLCIPYKLDTSLSNEGNVLVKYMSGRLRDDPLFPDYENATIIPMEFFEVEDWKSYLKDLDLKEASERKTLRINNLEREIRLCKSDIRTLNSNLERLQNQLAEELK